MKRETGIGIAIGVAMFATAGGTVGGDIAAKAIGAAGTWPVYAFLAAIAIVALIICYKLASDGILGARELTRDTTLAHQKVGKQISELRETIERSEMKSDDRMAKLIASVQVLADVMPLSKRCAMCMERGDKNDGEEIDG